MIIPRPIAAAQTVPVRGDVGANLEQHLRLIRVAAEEQTQVLVFPELSLTGYELELARDLAFTEDDPRLSPLIEEASARSMAIIVGAPVRIGSLLSIGALILLPDGSVTTYTKHFLGAFSADDNPGGTVPPPEASIFAPGLRNPLLRFGGNIGALAVCADVSHAAHAQVAADRGAQAYFASMFLIPADLDGDALQLTTYARQYSMAVVFANYGGPSGGLPSAGSSAIWSDKGDLLAQLDVRGVGIVFAAKSDAGWRAGTVALDEG